MRPRNPPVSRETEAQNAVYAGRSFPLERNAGMAQCRVTSSVNDLGLTTPNFARFSSRPDLAGQISLLAAPQKLPRSDEVGRGVGQGYSPMEREDVGSIPIWSILKASSSMVERLMFPARPFPSSILISRKEVPCHGRSDVFGRACLED
jgi:hypothetical protein